VARVKRGSTDHPEPAPDDLVRARGFPEEDLFRSSEMAVAIRRATGVPAGPVTRAQIRSRTYGSISVG